jgi:hypothetical protein
MADLGVNGLSAAANLNRLPVRPNVAPQPAGQAMASDALALGQANAPVQTVTGQRTVQAALKEAAKVFLGSATIEDKAAKRAAKQAGDTAKAAEYGYIEIGLGQQDYRRVDVDAFDANWMDPSTTWRDTKRETEATRQVAMNQPLVSQALERLSGEQRAQYAKVATALAEDPAGSLALQIMLLDGRLASTSADARGGSLLGNLAGLAADTPLHADIPREQLLGHLVREIYNPGAINQLDYGSCSVTTLQILTADKRPAEYVRLITGLAGPAGEVTTASGDSLKRLAGTEKPQVKEDGSNDDRTVSSRLWQSAMLEAGAQGSAHHYDVKKDALENGDSAGLGASQVEKIYEMITGAQARGESIPEEQLKLTRESMALLDELAKAKDPAEIARIQGRLKDVGTLLADVAERLRPGMVAGIEAALAKGHPVPISVDQWRPVGEGDAKVYLGTHELLVTRMDAERVYYRNPQGTEESMTRAELLKRLASVVLPE